MGLFGGNLMDVVTKEILYGLLEERYHVSRISDEHERELFKSNIVVFINELYDLERKAVAPLTKKETFAVRKFYGVLDNGIIQDKKEVAKTMKLNSPDIANKIRFGAVYNLRIRLELSGTTSNELSIFDTSIIDKSLSEMAVGELEINDTTFSLLLTSKIFNMGDLLTYKTSTIKALIRNKTYVSKLIEEVHKLGLRFIDELTRTEKESAIIQTVDEEKLLNSDISWLGLDKLLESKARSIGVHRIKDLTKVIITSQELLKRLKELGIDDMILNRNKNIPNMTYSNLSINDMGFSIKTRAILLGTGVKDLQQLRAFTIDEVITLCKKDKRYYEEIIDKVHSYGLLFSKEVEQPKKTLDDVDEFDVHILNHQESLQMQIKNLNLPPRAGNAILRSGITTVIELLQNTKEELLKIKGLGPKTAGDVIEIIHGYGLVFAGEESNLDTVTDVDDKNIVNIDISESVEQDDIESVIRNLEESNETKRNSIRRKEELVLICNRLLDERQRLLSRVQTIDEELDNIVISIKTLRNEGNIDESRAKQRKIIRRVRRDGNTTGGSSQ